MEINGRRSIQALSLSALAFVAWIVKEGWSGTATPPIPGDVPTYGFGTTTHADGSSVKNGETISPVQAVRRVAQDASRFEGALKRCMAGAELTQYEYDALVLLAENVGDGAVCRSSIPGKVKAGKYEAACRSILDFAGITRTINGKRVRLSCEVRSNGCYGVWRARQDEYRLCMTGEYPK